MDELLTEFVIETTESLNELDSALVRLERTPDDRATLALIFRLVHTIKGTCGFLGLPRLEHVTHAAETVLGQVRDGELPATPDVVSLVLEALDRVKAIIAGLASSGGEPDGDDRTLIAALDRAGKGSSNERPASKGPACPPGDPDLDIPDHDAIAADLMTADPIAADPVTAPTIRVAIDLLDHLMTLVSELVLTRNQLLQLARGQEASLFVPPLQVLSQLTSELQEGVMKTRMQPIGNAWNKLPRMVRELARDLGKQIEVTLRGAETELDRQVLELIRDPLTHMVRNAADHGLEPPGERRSAGKPDTGTIALNAFHEGGHIVIEIADDGRGLSAERIRAKAIAQGLATEADLARLHQSQLLRFIFRPGFSTASAITAVSGRGVGMDVVKTNIERIGGTVELRSIAGAGTRFTIKIPLTLAIVSALLVAAGGERFAIPQLCVRELVRAEGEGSGSQAVIERINDTAVLRLRDRLLPLVSLQELLRLPPAAVAGVSPIIVVTQLGSERLGLMVDRVFDTEEIVVKPMAPMLRHIGLFSGNTILGDGSVIMILDPNGIARACGIDSGAGAAGDRWADDLAAASPAAAPTPMLLFHAGGPQLLAVPLHLLSRIEQIPRAAIEPSSGPAVTQYRGRLMPLIPLSDQLDQDSPLQQVLVFAEAARSAGLLLDEIVDVVEDRLEIELAGAAPGLLGTAVIGGRAADVIDTGYWLTRAWPDWFGDAASAPTAVAA